MRAIVAHAAKDLKVEDRPIPELGPHEIRVRTAFGGICGSDLHYYHEGGFGAVRLREPMILGHEVSGIVEAVGAEAGRVKPGDRVAVNPSLPCNRCRYCLEGRQNSASTCASMAARCDFRMCRARSGRCSSAAKLKRISSPTA